MFRQRNLSAVHRRESEKGTTRCAVFLRAAVTMYNIYIYIYLYIYICESIYIIYLHNAGQDIISFSDTLFHRHVGKNLKNDGCEIFQVLNAFGINNEWRK